MCLQHWSGMAFTLTLSEMLNITSKRIANEDARPVQAHLRGFFGNAHHFRHFPGVELFHIAKDQDQAVMLGEGQDGVLQPAAQFLLQDNLFRRNLP